VILQAFVKGKQTRVDKERAGGKAIWRTKEVSYLVGKNVGMGTFSSIRTPVSLLNPGRDSLLELSPQFTFNPDRFEDPEEQEDWCLDEHRERKE
jgi:hypothetical protein